MSRQPDIKIIQLHPDQAEQLFKRIEPRIEPEDFKLIVEVFNSVPQVLEYLSNENITVKKLRRMLFGVSTEKTARVFPQEPQNPSQNQPPQPAAKEIKKRPGHGRNGAQDYTGASVVEVPHPHLHDGDCCPACKDGLVRLLKEQAKIIRILAQPMFPATLFNLEQLRCGRCGEVFTAPAPAQAGLSKYDPNVGCQLGIMHYEYGVPMLRLQTVQQNLGVPMPIGTQWQLIESTAKDIAPAFEELDRQAAQSMLFHSDDTHMLILDVAKEIKVQTVEEHDSERKRTGIFTTGIVARFEGHDIVLYRTGRQHAGENFSDVLLQRSKDLPPPMLMCDALSRNAPKEFQIILLNCLSHGRRQFVDLVTKFPEECRRMLDDLSHVYLFDAQAREQNLSPQARLEFHKANSGPIMAELHDWMQSRMDGKFVEPNSALGGAFKYMLKHWEALTGFLKTPGAPLDNNLCERILKKAILHRKNSLFYKTANGARVGDIFMSLIQTCKSCGANAFVYLTTLIQNRERLKENPSRWLPWNFKESLCASNSA
jgi:transposase